MRAVLWYQTDSRYKRAIEQLTTIKTHNQLKVDQEDKSDDGMELPRYESIYSVTPETLPSDAAVLQRVDQMITDLKALKQAPSQVCRPSPVNPT